MKQPYTLFVESDQLEGLEVNRMESSSRNQESSSGNVQVIVIANIDSTLSKFAQSIHKYMIELVRSL